MKRKHYYIVVGAISLTGIALSVFFLPKNTDTPLMYLYDKQYERAYEFYREHYERGDRSTNVMIPLVNILMEYAQIDQSIELMEEYVSLNPDSVDALRFLAKVYHDANRSYDYLRVLEEIYAIKPSIDVLREKEKYYGYVGDTEKEIESLESIKENYKPTQGEYLELAYQYASKGDTDAAAETIDQFLQTVPFEKMDASTVEFAVDLLADQKRAGEALALAEKYYQFHPTINTAILLSTTLYNGLLHDEALSLLDRIPMVDQKNPKVIVTRANLLLSKKQPHIAFEYLKSVLNEGKLPNDLLSEVLSLAVEYQEIAILEKVMHSHAIDDLPEPILVKVLLSAYLNGREDMVTALQSMLDSESIQSQNALFLTFSLLSGDRLTQENIEQLSNLQRALLATVTSEIKGTDDTKRLLGAIDTFEEIPYDELESLTYQFIENDLAEKGWEYIQELRSQNLGNNKLNRSWFLFGSALGKEDPLIVWLEKQKRVDPKLIKGGFYFAYENKHASLSMYLANTYYNLRPTFSNKKMVAEALLLNGYTEWAFEIFNELLAGGEDVAEAYVNALVILSKENPKYREDLDDVVQVFLEKKVLSENGWRNLGYLLVENQRKDLAATVFLRLASGKTIDNEDMQSLLWIWGKDLNQTQLQWVVDHAKQSSGVQKGKWVQLLVDTEHPQYAMNLVAREEWAIDEVADALVQALIMAKQKRELSEVIAYVIPQESRLPRLKKFGKLAYGEGLKAIAETVYTRALQQDPMDQDSLMALGEIAYSRGQYCRAMTFLRQIKRNFLASYYIAEIYTVWEWVGIAPQYYRRALCEYDQLEKPNTYQQSVQAHLFYRIGSFEKAVTLYEQLLEKDLKNLYLRADLANILLDLGHLVHAREVLWDSRVQHGNQEGVLAVELARVRYYKERICYNKALSLSEQLLVRYPKSAQVRASRSDLLFSVKKWEHSLCYISQAQSLEPLNASYCLAKEQIILDHRPELFISGEYRRTGDEQTERLNHLLVKFPVCTTDQLLFHVERDHIDLELYSDIQNARLRSVDDERYRGEAAWIHDFWNGDRLTSSIYFTPKNFGAGFLFEHPDLCGSTVLSLEYHRPNWDFTQTIIDYGTRDMVAIKRTQPLLPRFEVSLLGSLNRYNLRGLSDAASTWGLEGSATYALSKGDWFRKFLGRNGTLSLNYYLDAEYEFHVSKRIDLFANAFFPLPFINREIHSGVIFLAKQIDKYLLMEGFGGWSWDRVVKGQAAPIWGTHVIVGDRYCLQGRFVYSHTTSTQIAGQSVDRYLLDLRWRW